MKKALYGVATLLALAVTTVSHAELTIDSKKEVAYTCNLDGHRVKINAMYGIKDGEVVVAQLKVDGNISPGLFRIEDPSRVLNRFMSASDDGTMWTTMPANGEMIDKVDGGTLSVRNNQKSNTVLLDKCALDKSMTAKLKKK